MKFRRRFQEGGPMPGGQGDPMQQLLQAAAQAVQNQDGALALQVCQALVELASGGQQGGAPAGPGDASMGGAPEGAPEEAPMARQGGRLVARKYGERNGQSIFIQSRC